MNGQRVIRNNLLIVGESPTGDNSMIALSQAKMDELSMTRGDAVILKGKRRRETACIVLSQSDCPHDNILMNQVVRSNLRVSLGDTVSIELCSDITYGKRVHILPIDDTVDGFDGNLFKVYLKPYFLEAYRPIHKGDCFTVRGSTRTVEFQVVETDPTPFCMVAPDTVIHCEGDPIKRKEIEDARNAEGYDDIGGCQEQVAEIRRILSLSLEVADRPNGFRVATGMKPPRGILFHGPPGTGKTLTARAMANEFGAYFFLINGGEMQKKLFHEKESNLSKSFEEAEKYSPSFIFIDDLDAIAPIRAKTLGEGQRNIVSQLLNLMDGFTHHSGVIVMAATNQLDSIDPALLRCGRFDTEIEFGIPNAMGRLEILRIHTRKMKLYNDLDLEKIAAEARGFVGADLAALCSGAIVERVRELNVDNHDLLESNCEVLCTLRVTMDNFRQALDKVTPKILRRTGVELPNDVTWKNVFGLDDIKKELKEIVQDKLTSSIRFHKMGLQPCNSVLLYGPPGCGKTLLAKAIANECKVNFILINSYETLEKVTFDKVCNIGPCIIFIDNLDLLGHIRSEEAVGSKENVFAQMVNLIDEIKSHQDIFLLGATSRPDLIDPAMLRPGRFDKLLYISLPNEQTRSSMFQGYLKNSPLSKDINMAYLVKSTHGYSGSDIFAICQEAGRLAIRQQQLNDDMSPPPSKRANRNSTIQKDKNDNVPEISRTHFEQALTLARRSVSESEVEKFEKFVQPH